MRKQLKWVVLMLVMLCVLSACGVAVPGETTVPTEPPVPEPADHIDATGTLSVAMIPWETVPSHYDQQGNHCCVIQGSCTDGTYLYMGLNDGHNMSEDSLSAIYKFELSTGKMVATYDNLKVSHCNDMTCNSETGELIVVHCMPDSNVISIFDIHTMELKEEKELRINIDSLAYDPYEKCYWASISNGHDFAKLDLDFQKISPRYLGYGGYIKQGMDVDSVYLYFLHYNKNVIRIFTKDGRFVRQIELPVTEHEPENICHVGDVFYIGYYTYPVGGKVYRTTIEN